MLSTIRDTARRGRAVPHTRPLAMAIGILCAGKLAAEPQFNLDFLRGQARNQDIAVLRTAGNVLPGVYPFTVYLNGVETAREDISFVDAVDQTTLPCLQRASLQTLGIRLPTATATQIGCVDLAKELPGAHVSYNGNQQRLDITVPQLYLQRQPKGYIPPALRDQGINALLLDYRISGAHTNRSGRAGSDYFFASINSGLNLGSWRLRHVLSITDASSLASHWRSRGFRAETDFNSSNSRLIAGDTYTSQGLFDSVRFRGAQLRTDEQMLPYSQRSYAPIIRGIAASNARIEIRQDGNLIQSSSVAAGPFEIDDIVPNRMSGQLEVTVIESDGSRQHYNQPFSAVQSMLRPGLFQYELNLGSMRAAYGNHHPGFAQATASWGLASNTTPQAGLLIGKNYKAVAIGLAQGLGSFGSASVDVTHARTRTSAGLLRSGQSYRFLYSKSLNNQGTELRLLGHRYSTAGYYDFNDAALERAQWRKDSYISLADTHAWPATGNPSSPMETSQPPFSPERYHNKRSRLEASLHQRMGNTLSVNASYTQQRYWGINGSVRNLHLGLNGRWGPVNIGLFLRDSRTATYGDDRLLGLTLNFPLDGIGQSRYALATSHSHSTRGGNTHHLGINGVALADARLSYGAALGHDDSGNSLSANAQYGGRYGIASATLTHAEGYRQLNWEGSGGVVLHAGGLTLAQSLQRTNVLVQAEDGAGIGLQNNPGTRLNKHGYAISTGLTAYTRNTLALRTDDLDAGIDVSKTVANVIPTAGALTRVQFRTRRGLSLMIHALRQDGTPIPLGASVFDSNGQSRGIAGPSGDLFVTGVQHGEHLVARWGERPEESCALWLALPYVEHPSPAQPGYQHIHLQCLPITGNQQSEPS